jgi:DNA-binding LacI/PurR family transcriptional regulator
MPPLSSLKTPKYVVLADEVREQIEQGVLKPGDRLPSFAEMRGQHGVTWATVDRIYTHLENAGLVVREQGRGTFVKQPEVREATGVIGIAGLTLSQHPYFVQLVEGFREVAAKTGVEVLLLNDITAIKREKIDGIISCDTGFARHELWKYLPTGLPCVLTLINARDFTSIIADEYQGAYDLTKHLLKLGHRRIGYMYDPFLTPRLFGYQNALRDAGIEFNENWTRTVTFDQTPDCTYSSAGYAVMESWLQEGWAESGCTAVLTQNDDTAMGVIHALSKVGLRVPEDVSVAGYDGTDAGKYFVPRLTSVMIPLREIGMTAMDLLLRQIHGEEIRPSTIVLPAHVVAGGSVRGI